MKVLSILLIVTAAVAAQAQDFFPEEAFDSPVEEFPPHPEELDEFEPMERSASGGLEVEPRPLVSFPDGPDSSINQRKAIPTTHGKSNFHGHGRGKFHHLGGQGHFGHGFYNPYNPYGPNVYGRYPAYGGIGYGLGGYGSYGKTPYGLTPYGRPGFGGYGYGGYGRRPGIGRGYGYGRGLSSYGSY